MLRRLAQANHSIGLEDVKTKVEYRLWERQEGFSAYCSCGIQRIGCASLAQAFAQNVRTCRNGVKRKLQASGYR